MLLDFKQFFDIISSRTCLHFRLTARRIALASLAYASRITACKFVTALTVPASSYLVDSTHNRCAYKLQQNPPARNHPGGDASAAVK